MRLFIGIALDESMREYIEHRKESIAPFVETGRFTYKNNLHLTMKFLGEVRDDDLRLITNKLKELEHTKRSFELYLDHLGEFQKRNKSILWIGVKENSDIIDLYESMEELIEEFGFKKDNRPYIPHITLGRGMRFNVPFEKVRGNVHIKHECVHVREITLYESARVKGKLAYIPIQTVKLE